MIQVQAVAVWLWSEILLLLKESNVPLCNLQYWLPAYELPQFFPPNIFTQSWKPLLK